LVFLGYFSGQGSDVEPRLVQDLVGQAGDVELFHQLDEIQVRWRRADSAVLVHCDGAVVSEYSRGRTGGLLGKGLTEAVQGTQAAEIEQTGRAEDRKLNAAQFKKLVGQQIEVECVALLTRITRVSGGGIAQGR
jgi:hypothetical protein